MGPTVVYMALQASHESATDLRLWSSYVQLLALLGNQEEAIKVAEKALSMVQVRLATGMQPHIVCAADGRRRETTSQGCLTFMHV